MRRLLTTLALLLALLPRPLAADAPTDIGAAPTTSGASGELAADLVSARNSNTLSSPRANRTSIRENEVNLTPDPTCANMPTGYFHWIDTDEANGTFDPKLCVGSSTWFDVPNMGSDVIAAGEVLRGTGTGTGDYGKVGPSNIDLTDTYPFTGLISLAGGAFVFPASTDGTCAGLGAPDGRACWATDTDLLYIGDLSQSVWLDPYRRQAVTVASNGSGTAATFNLDPTSRYIEITCNDTDGCDGTLQETSAKEPRHVTIVNLSTNRVRFTDVANVLTLAGTPTYLPQYGTLVLVYEGTRWVQEQAPLRILEDGVAVGGALGVDFDNRFSLTLTPATGNLSVAPGAAFTMVGDIDKADLPAVTVFDDEPNDFGANQQTIENLDIENAAGTTVAECNIAADGSCRYTGGYAHADDFATKGDVDRVALQFTGSLVTDTAGGTGFGGAGGSDGLRSARSWIGYLTPINTLAALYQAPMATACTITALSARLTAVGGSDFPVPTGNLLTFIVRKNNSATGQASCTITAGNNTGSCTGLSSPSFAAPSGTTVDTYQFRASCSNAGSDCTDTTDVVLTVSALCS